MTVGQLIEQLKSIDPELPAVFQDDWGKTWGIEDIAIDSLTNMETDEFVECAILLDRVLTEV